MGAGGLWIGPWFHQPPETARKDGKRVLLRRLCFGPAESWVWYELDGAFFREVRGLEGLQTGEASVDAVSRDDLRRLLDAEAVLCESQGGASLAALFRAEAVKLL